jgi:hypothetical protein
VDYIEGGVSGVYNGNYAVADDMYVIFDGDTEYPDEFLGVDSDGNLVIDTFTEDTHIRIDQKYFINKADAIAYGEANGNPNCADYFPID